MSRGVGQIEEKRVGEPEQALRYFAAVEGVFRETARKISVREYYYAVGPYTCGFGLPAAPSTHGSPLR